MTAAPGIIPPQGTPGDPAAPGTPAAPAAPGSPGTPAGPDVVSSKDLNIKPFLVEPLILGRLARRGQGTAGTGDDGPSPFVVAIVSVLLVFCLVSWTALLTNAFYRPHWDLPVVNDIWAFLSRGRTGGGAANGVPYLRDYPSWILSVSIASSVPLVYGIFRSLQTLHESLDESHCIKCDDAARRNLKSAVDELNEKFARHGKYSWAVLAAALAVTTGINLRLRGRLFHFLGSGALYDHWWARLVPVTPGGVVWVLLGGLGMYMVYAEAVVGIRYVKFLKRCRNDYRFGTNPLNPDNFYGWAKLRQAVSNLQGGLICTVATSFAMFFFLQPAIGWQPTIVVLGLFIAMVLYVFVASMTHIRRQIRRDRQEQIDRIIADMPDPNSGVPSDAIAYLVALERLRDVQRLPSMPIRNTVLFAGALSVLAPVIAMGVQIMKLWDH